MSKKYSKMKPTPLGKKSYAEYAKELKEFNLSKVEGVELNANIDFEKEYNNAASTHAKGTSDILLLKLKVQQIKH